MKTSLVTGVMGQDGAYLSKLLLDKGYKVYGMVRRSSSPHPWRLKELGIEKEVELMYGDLMDQESLNLCIQKSKPELIFNTAAQSFVGTSWEQPILTSEVNALGVVRLLDAIRNHAPNAKTYQCSTTEMFGNSNTDGYQNEDTPFHPRSPYGVAKLHAHWSVINYRESYNIFACCGIFSNHESKLRGIEFVTRKISDGVARIKLGLSNELRLGNLESKRDWGHAQDFVRAMYLMLQQEKPEEFLISTGINHSVRDFCQLAFNIAGIKDWEKYVIIDDKFKRPAELFELKGSSKKAHDELGWYPNITFEELVEEMVEADINRLK